MIKEFEGLNLIDDSLDFLDCKFEFFPEISGGRKLTMIQGKANIKFILQGLVSLLLTLTQKDGMSDFILRLYDSGLEQRYGDDYEAIKEKSFWSYMEVSELLERNCMTFNDEIKKLQDTIDKQKITIDNLKTLISSMEGNNGRKEA